MATREKSAVNRKKRKGLANQKAENDSAIGRSERSCRSVLTRQRDDDGKVLQRGNPDDEPREIVAQDGDPVDPHIMKRDVQDGSTSRPKKKIKRNSKPTRDLFKKDDLYPVDSQRDFVNSISNKSLSRGDTIIGRIKEINEFELLISLPYGLLGTVSLAEMSNYIAEGSQRALEDENDLCEVPDPGDHFYVDQIVTCSVVDVRPKENNNKKLKICLSLRPDIVNREIRPESFQSVGTCFCAEIRSIEDYGYTLDVGIEDIRLFLNFTNVPTLFSDHEKKILLRKGSILTCCMISEGTSKSKNLAVSLYPRDKSRSIDKMKIRSDSDLDYEDLRAGALIEARVKKVLDPSGIILSVLGLIEAYALKVHSICGGYSERPQKLSELYSEGQVCLAKILWTSRKSRTIHVSLKSELLYNQPSGNIEENIGRIYDDLKVVDTHRGYGVMLHNANSGFSLAHITQISDNPRDVDISESMVGSIRKGRVTGYDMVDNLQRVSLQKSVIEAPFVRISELQPGSLVKGVVTRLEDYGAIVNLGLGLRALCLKGHFLDAPIFNKNRQVFKVGKEYGFMVYEIDHKLRKVLVTHKKTLMGSDILRIQSYDISYLNKWSMGVLVAIKEYGLIIGFFNGVKGLIPLKEIDLLDDEKSASSHKILSKRFVLNQLIKCRVIYTNSSEKRMSLSLRQPQSNQEGMRVNNITSVESSLACSRPEVGELVSGKVLKKISDTDMLVLLNEHEGILATINKLHLSDYRMICDIIWDTVQDGDHLNDMAILSLSPENDYLVLTRKPLMIKFIRENAVHISSTQLSDFYSFVKVDKILVGYVKEIQDRRCIIGFWGGCTGILGASNISDKYVVDLKSILHVGQTIITVVKDVMADKRRFYLSTSKDDLLPEIKNEEFLVQNLKNFFAERDNIYSNSGKCRSDLPKIGSLLSGEVVAKTFRGPVLQLKNDLYGNLLHSCNSSPPQVNIGDTVEGVVVDKYSSSNIVDVIHYDKIGLSDISKAYTSKGFRSRLMKKVEEKRVVDGVKIASKGNLGILTIPKLNNMFVYAWLCTEPNSYFGGELGGTNKKTKFRIALHSIDDENRVLGAVIPSRSIESGFIQEIIDPIDPKLRVITDIRKGMILKSRILSIKKTQINLYLAQNLRGRLHVLELYDSLNTCLDPKKPFSSFRANQIVEAKVIGYHDAKSHRYLPFSHRVQSSEPVIDFTIRPSEMATPEYSLSSSTTSPKIIPVDTKVIGYVESLKNDSATVRISRYLSARLPFLRATTEDSDINNKNSEILSLNVLRNYYVERSKEGSVEVCGFDPSLRPIPSIGNLDIGTRLLGTVVKVSTVEGLIIRISPKLYGRVRLTDISDYICDNPTSRFSCKQHLNCTVILINKEKNIIDLSLRRSKDSKSPDGSEEGAPQSRHPVVNSIEELEVGQIRAGYVVKVLESSVIVELGRGISALVHSRYSSSAKQQFSEIVEGSVLIGIIIKIHEGNSRVEMLLHDPAGQEVLPNWEDIITTGSAVDGKISWITNNRITIQIKGIPILGRALRRNFTDDPNFDPCSYYELGDDVKALVLSSGLNYVDLCLKPQMLETAKREITTNNERQDQSHDDKDSSVLKIGVTPLPIDSGEELFPQINGRAADASNRAGLSSELLDNGRPEKTAGSDKHENLSLSGLSTYSTGSINFERLLLASPNSSYLWIKYIAFLLSISDINKAREIAERALVRISFREEHERLNIWIAWMNLENTYGRNEDFEAVMNRAILQVNPKKIYIIAARVLIQSNKHAESEAVYGVALKKFRTSYKIWHSYMMYLMKKGSFSDARSALQKAIANIPKHKHVKMISGFAQMEFKFGDPERGRTMFEGILSTYPTRMDIWSIYTDMEVKIKCFDSVRRLFNRITAMKISSKKMKFALKKYINFEMAYGTPQGVENVKKIATGYLEKSMG